MNFEARSSKLEARPSPHLTQPSPLPQGAERGQHSHPRAAASALSPQRGEGRGEGCEPSPQAPSGPRVNFLGCPLDLLTSAQLLEELRQAIDTRSGPRVIQFVNANKVAQVYELPDMGPIMWRAHYVLADGQPMLPLARMLGIHVPERIDGIGLMGKLLALADLHRYSVFLLGAKQPVVEACVDRIRREFPNLRIAGFRNGYFSPDQAAEVVAQVRAARPDILFLGMGSPMKERFADRYATELGATVIQGVGGSFDVWAGLVKRAPVWLQRLGLEWLYRVLQEPKRMAWRYARTNATCLWVFGRTLIARWLRRAG
jgi:N-acetylglucosaminyldiphosphoundecaprenol N-acetyl-beta-D-mannosaminyltransferase